MNRPHDIRIGLTMAAMFVVPVLLYVWVTNTWH